MILTAFALMASVCTAASSADGSVRGSVIDAESGAAVPLASILVKQWPEGDVVDEVSTGENGQFAFPQVSPGKYMVSASKSGYVDLFPARSPFREVSVPAREDRVLRLPLTRAAAIVGNVIHADGRPARGVRVMALVRRGGSGGEELVAAGTDAVVDERGNFRLHSLAPGRYTISVAPQGRDASERAFAPAYYPGVLSPDKAEFFRIKAGETRAGTAIVLQQAAGCRISGSIGGFPDEWKERGAAIKIVPLGGTGTPLEVATSDAQGRFQSGLVPPGSYELVAYGPVIGRGPFGPLAGDNARQGRIRLEVTSEQTLEVQIPLEESFSLGGRFVLERPDEPARGCFVGSQVSLQPVVAGAQEALRSGPAGPRGEFTVRNAFSGRYKVVVEGLKSPCFLKEARLGEDRVAGRAITVESNRQLTVVLGSKTGTFEGIVGSGPDKPVPGAVIVLVAVASSDVQVAFSDEKGQFRFQEVVPGLYRVLALKIAASSEYLDPLLWKERAAAVIEFPVEPGSTVNVDLRIAE